MRSLSESSRRFVTLCKRAAALETKEGCLATWHPRDGAPATEKRMPIEGVHPTSVKSEIIKQFDNFVTFIEQKVAVAEQDFEYGNMPKRRSNPAWEARRKIILSEVGVSPVALAFVYGYSTDRRVRELRIRHGKDPDTGYPLKGDRKALTRRGK